MDLNKRTLIEVRCREDKDGRQCGSYLGYFDVDGDAHFGVYHCRNCRRTHIYEVDEDGMVRRSVTKKQLFLKTKKSVPVVEVVEYA